MENITDFIQRAADRTGFIRERYMSKNIPTQYSAFLVMLFAGDLRHEFVLSSLLMPRFVRELNGSRYVILCGYPGHGALFPYVHEYWGLRDEATFAELLTSANGFGNTNNKRLHYEQQLNRYFADIVCAESMDKFYQHGLTQTFFETFATITYELPAITSPRPDIGKQLTRLNPKVLLHPSRRLYSWFRGDNHLVPCPRGFWTVLIKKLIDNQMTPVIYQTPAAFDMSVDFGERCAYCVDRDMSNILAVMRSVGCVLDVFSDLSRLAITARTPFVSCIERPRYFATKDYELDDMLAVSIPHEYIFTFATMIEAGQWDDVTESIIHRLTGFLPGLDREAWPATSETSALASYKSVREKKNKRIGTKFIRVPKI